MKEQLTNIQVEIVREGVSLPNYVHFGDAGMDVKAATDIIIKPGQSVLVPTGLKFGLPVGYEIQVRPRSGLSYKTPIRLPNAPGTIDAGYRDELFILMSNSSCDCQVTDPEAIYDLTEKENKKGTYIIHKGDRIAQLIFSKVDQVHLVSVSKLEEIKHNRGGGFGHSGVK